MRSAGSSCCGCRIVAGLRWWRDWSTHWDTVQPKQGGPFDFSLPDLDVNYILGAQGPPGGAAAFAHRRLGRRRQPRAIADSQRSPQRSACERRANAAGDDRLQAGTVGGFRRVRAGDREALPGPGHRLRDPQRAALHRLRAAREQYGYKTSDYLDLLQDGLSGGQVGRPQVYGDRRHRLPAGQRMGRGVHRARAGSNGATYTTTTGIPRGNGPKGSRPPSRCAGSR